MSIEPHLEHRLDVLYSGTSSTGIPRSAALYMMYHVNLPNGIVFTKRFARRDLFFLPTSSRPFIFLFRIPFKSPIAITASCLAASSTISFDIKWSYWFTSRFSFPFNFLMACGFFNSPRRFLVR